MPLQLDPDGRLQRRGARLQRAGAYANGYDVMIAQRICDANGWELEVVSTAWDSLIPPSRAAPSTWPSRASP